jgi:hypothetical protein
MDELGRISQDALYYHEGSSAPIPQEKDRYMYAMQAPAAIRKTGPWVVSLSGIVETQAPTNQYYLDRQANLSIFHTKLGLVVSGANSKRQPELATFRETIDGVTYALPQSSRLQMADTGDRLSVALNSFFSDLYVDPPAPQRAAFHFVISGKGTAPQEAFLTLQLVLHPGEDLEADGKRMVLSADPVDLTTQEIRHHGWTLHVDSAARLTWPVYPYNPYADARETTLDHAVAALSIPLRLHARSGHYVRPHEQEIAFTLSTQ